MKARTIKRRRYATRDYDLGYLRLMQRVATVRQIRRRVLLGGDTLAKLRAMLAGPAVKPGVRRLLRGFVQADMASIRADGGGLFELRLLADFMSPQARRNLDARLEARMLGRLSRHVRARMAEQSAA